MPRPRLPADVAKITGAEAKNAGRFRNRAAPKVKSLGPAPKHYGEDQAALWDEFNDDFPWLGRSDRRLVGLAVVLQTQIDEAGRDAPTALIAQMRLLLSSMGGTPVDRTKVKAADDETDDPADQYFN